MNPQDSLFIGLRRALQDVRRKLAAASARAGGASPSPANPPDPELRRLRMLEALIKEQMPYEDQDTRSAADPAR